MSGMKKTQIGQDDLRRMMQKVKETGGQGQRMASNSKNKKYKLSSRELALLEEQKAKKALEEKRKREKAANSALPKGFFEAQPKKGILKNSSTSVQAVSTSHVPTEVLRKRPQEPTEEQIAAKKAKREEKVETPNTESETPEEESGAAPLPEGFFDDPVQDAKARHIEYKDPAEEEWEKFQKEINQEMDTAQEIVKEEQQEATIERQLEEVDEQIRAWSKVSEMEKKLETVEAKVQEKKNASKDTEMEEDEDSLDEEDLFLDWRNKC